MKDYTNEFTMIDNCIYTNVGLNGQWYKGDFLQMKNYDGLDFFIFEIDEFREDGMTYDGVFQKVEKTYLKNKKYIVGYFTNRNEGECTICEYSEIADILGNLIVLFGFNKVF